MPGGELLLGQMDLAKGFQLFEKDLEVRHVDHNGCATSFLGKDQGSPGLADFFQKRLRMSLEFGKRLDILVDT